MHHTEEKEKKTKDLLLRVVGILAEFKGSKITLNGKSYSKINFSQSQVINAMQEFASFDEKLDEVAITSQSTLSKNPKYINIINEAKIKRKNFQLKLKGGLGTTGDIELDYIGLKEQYAILEYKYKTLRHSYDCLDKIIEDSELSRLSPEPAVKTNTIMQTTNTKHKEVLLRLIELELSDYRLVVEKPAFGKKGALSYVTNEGIPLKICTLNDLNELSLPNELLITLTGGLE